MNISTETPKATGKIKEAGRAIQQKVFGYIAASFALVAGLAWNDAIKSLIDYLLPTTSGSIAAKLIYALIVTLFVIIVLYGIEKSTNTTES
jgi:hypothetical protein